MSLSCSKLRRVKSQIFVWYCTFKVFFFFILATKEIPFTVHVKNNISGSQLGMISFCPFADIQTVSHVVLEILELHFNNEICFSTGDLCSHSILRDRIAILNVHIFWNTEGHICLQDPDTSSALKYTLQQLKHQDLRLINTTLNS